MKAYYFQSIKSFVKKNFLKKPLKNYKYFRITVIILSLIFLFGVISWNLNREIFEKITLRNFFMGFFSNNEKNQVLVSQFNDTTGAEQTFINIKSMLIGIIIGITVFVSKKGSIGISLGIFIGGAIGLWISTFFPSIMYFFELLFRNLWNMA